MSPVLVFAKANIVGSSGFTTGSRPILSSSSFCLSVSFGFQSRGAPPPRIIGLILGAGDSAASALTSSWVIDFLSLSFSRIFRSSSSSFLTPGAFSISLRICSPVPFFCFKVSMALSTAEKNDLTLPTLPPSSYF